jgi:plastocyanin
MRREPGAQMSHMWPGSSVSAGSAARGFAMILIVVSLVLSPSAASSVRAAHTWTVTIEDNDFQPSTIIINVGDTVVWNNTGPSSHTATSLMSGAVTWDSGNLQPGQTFSFTFTVAGDFSYYCAFHDGMTGTVVVQAPVPEFPGLLALATVGVAVLLGLALERALRLNSLR